MEWLMVIAFVVISIMDSKKKSDQAKQQRAQRQQSSGQPIYRSGDNQKPQQPKSSGSLMESLTEFLETLEENLEGELQPQKKQPGGQPNKQPVNKQPVIKKQTTTKQAPDAGKTLMQSVGKKKTAEPQTAKKSPTQLPTKTLMEQRPDREKREEHTKVTASVKPLTANVKPLKNAFDNDEKCEHRIELNPNIQYSKQQQAATQRAAVVKTDGESIVQGIIWSEILGKPKAYQNQARRMGR